MLQSSRMCSPSSLTLVLRPVGWVETGLRWELWWEEALSRDMNSHFSHKHCWTPAWAGFSGEFSELTPRIPKNVQLSTPVWCSWGLHLMGAALRANPAACQQLASHCSRDSAAQIRERAHGCLERTTGD